jgi:hypothetical protein
MIILYYIVNLFLLDKIDCLYLKKNMIRFAQGEICKFAKMFKKPENKQ